ncbi:hypothetical protein LXN10_10090 [Arcobacter sp. KX21116]|uniref:hypothetical protein n=1 Tax=Arcobacter iocasae TaxID=2906515 RepID=UPI0035D400AA
MYQVNKKPIYLFYFSGVNFNNNNKEYAKYLEEKAKELKYRIYNLKENEQMLIEEIKKNKLDTIILITRNKKLFTNFNRPIKLLKIDEKISDFFDLNKDSLINYNIFNIIDSLKKYEIELVNDILKKVLFVYGDTFDIDISLLVKETTYLIDNKRDLMELIYEDVDMFKYKNIFTSRLSIIVYRLFFFDLNAKATGIGNFYHEALNIKSKSFSFKNLNNNCDGFYFTNLVNKPFRGYEIPPVKSVPVKAKPIFFEEKIKIAKRLLKENVKIKIVSNALEIEESELDKIIYGEGNIFPNMQINHSNSVDSVSDTKKNIF